MKPKTCPCCQSKFVPVRVMQKVCGPMCALEHSRKQSAKKAIQAEARERKQTRIKLDALQTKPQLVAKAQTAFNAFIRARDAGKACISCNTPLASEAVGGAFDCGHYRSVGSAPHMRFVEDNAAGQCKHCNRHLAGNHVAYRGGLLIRIGQRALELLESDQTLRKYTKEGLVEIAKHYREQAKKLKANHD